MQEFYEVTVKNVSGKNLKRVTFTFNDEGNYEVYELKPNDIYKINSFTNDDNFEFKVISIDYEIPNYSGKEVEITAKVEDNKILGTMKNTSQRQIYPNQIIMFFNDNTDGSIVQRTLEYSGCFDEGRVIDSGEEFEFEMEIPENTRFIAQKGITLKYSDLEFKEYLIYTQYDNLKM